MALLSFIEDLDDNETLFAVAADDTGATYIWPKGSEPMFEDDRIDRILEDPDQETPTDEQGWIELATLGLGHVTIRTPQSYKSLDDAIDEAEAGLPDLTKDPSDSNSDTLSAASAAYDDVSADFPGFGEDDQGGEDPQAMLNYVMMVLGPIDPDGPNGWLLRAAEGNPAPGDENEVIHWTDPGETEEAEE